MKNLAKRLTDLEQMDGEIILHFAEDFHDHAAEWERLASTRKRVRAIVFEGLNRGATDAFIAAMPEGALI